MRVKVSIWTVGDSHEQENEYTDIKEIVIEPEKVMLIENGSYGQTITFAVKDRSVRIRAVS